MKVKKNILLILLLMWIPFIGISQVVISESFETWLPTSWTSTIGSGTYNWQQGAGGHTGSYNAEFNAFNASSGSYATLTSYPFDLGCRGANNPTVTLWIYKDNSLSGSDDKIEIYINTTPSLTGASLLGTAHRYTTSVPAGANATWAQYTTAAFPAGFTGATNYILFKAISAFGNNLFMDDVQWTSYPGSGIACSGAPTAGSANASVTTFTNCTGGATNLSLSGSSTTCGLTYQWQSSPDNATWSNIAGATSPTYTPTVATTTYFHCIVSCGGSNSTSSSVQVTVNTCYYINTSTVTIASCPFTAGFYDSGGPSGQYADNENYTMTFTAPAGTCLSVTFTTFTVENTYDYLHIYDGPTTASSQFGTGYTGGTSPGTITSTGTSLTFKFTSDISNHYNGWVASIQCNPGCSGTPTGGTAAASIAGGCAAYATNLSLSGNSTCGVTYQWQSSTDNSTWSNIAGATAATYTPTVSASTYYRCMLTCSNGGATGASSSVYCAEGTPPNNACASPTAMGAFTTINNAQANTVTYSVSTVGYNNCATADQTAPACNNANQNVWYSFTAPVAGSYYIGVDAGTIAYPEAAVWSGACGSLTLLGCTGVSGGGCVIGTSNGTAQPYGFNSQTYSYAGACNLTAGQVVLVSVDNWCGWNPGTFTLSAVSISNDGIPAAGIIASCGTAFNSSTIGATNCNNCTGTGYYNDFDCNAGTVASGNNSGADVYPGMSVENDSWYQFCTTTAQTYSVTLTPTSATCKGPDANTTTELQMNLFTGTPSALTWVAGSTAGTSPLTYTISLAANGCAYIEVDGFAGTNCDYSILLQASPGCPLPLNLLSFKGDLTEAKKVKVNWILASEKEISYYLVERSADGIDYRSIAKINSHGNTNSQVSYSVLDEKPLTGFNYYRLSAVDLNGIQNIAAHTMVTNRSHLPGFNVYPNPAKDKINVSLVNFSSAVTIEIYDMYGKQVFSSVAIPENGNMLQEIDLSSFVKGVYFVKAFDGENIFKQSIIVNNDR